MTLNTNTQQLIVWIMIGAVAGSLVSMLFYRQRTPVTDLGSLGLGLLGALLGRVLFDLFGIRLGVPALIFTFDDLVAAILGSLILLVAIRYLRR